MSTQVQLGQPAYFWSGSTLSFFPTTGSLPKDHVYSLWINNNTNVHFNLIFIHTKIRGTVKLIMSHLCSAIGTLPYTPSTALLKPQSPNNSVVCELKLSPMGICAMASIDTLKNWRDLMQKPESPVARIQMCIMNVKEWKIYTKTNTQTSIVYKVTKELHTNSQHKVWKALT